MICLQWTLLALVEVTSLDSPIASKLRICVLFSTGPFSLYDVCTQLQVKSQLVCVCKLYHMLQCIHIHVLVLGGYIRMYIHSHASLIRIRTYICTSSCTPQVTYRYILSSHLSAVVTYTNTTIPNASEMQVCFTFYSLLLHLPLPAKLLSL